MGERRTAAEALEVSKDVQSFINNGLEVVSNREKAEETVSSQRSEQVDKSNVEKSEQQGTKQKRIRKPTSKQKTKSKPREERGVQPRSELSRTFAKATIQKTVRFKPQLIARLDDWIVEQQAEAERVMSFQEIQNEALAQWLDSRK